MSNPQQDIVSGGVVEMSELSGAELDAAVAKALGWHRHEWSPGDFDWRLPPTENDELGELMATEFEPSTDWSQGGEIIEKERIDILFDGLDGMEPAWTAAKCDQEGRHIEEPQSGPTPLIAAMRAFVASKA